MSAITLPVVTIAATDAAAAEGNASDTETVQHTGTGSTASPLTVQYTVGRDGDCGSGLSELIGECSDRSGTEFRADHGDND